MVRAMVALRSPCHRLAAAALSTLTLLAPMAAPPHPRIFVLHHRQVLFDRDGAAGVRMVWRFDEMYS